MEPSVIRVRIPPALNSPAVQVLTDALLAATASDDARVLVLEGGTDVFCTGLDITGIGPESKDADIELSIRTFAAGLTALSQSPHPTLAVVRGPALGGGLGLAVACDVVLASNSAAFGLSEGLFGLVPAVIAPVLLQRISIASLRRLTLTAERVSADEAKAIGLVDQIVADSIVEAHSRRLMTALARVHPRTRHLLSEAIAHTGREGLPAAIGRGVHVTVDGVRSQEVRDRIARFLEGGTPW